MKMRIGLALVVPLLGYFLHSSEEEVALIFPQYVNGEVDGVLNSSRIILQNSSSLPNSGRILFKRSDGQPALIPVGGELVSALPYQMEPWGAVEIMTDGTGDLLSGPIEVICESGDSAGLEGTEIFSVLGNLVSVNSATPESKHRLYVSFSASENTGLAVYNQDPDRSVRLELTLLNHRGELSAVRQIDLEPGTHFSKFVDAEDLFKEFLQQAEASFTGTLNISTQPGSPGVSVVGLVQKRATGALIAVNPNNRSFSLGPANAIWDHARNQGLWTHQVNPERLARRVQEPSPLDRGRVQALGGTVLTDNGRRLRGEHLRVAPLPYQSGTHMERAFDVRTWIDLSEKFSLNSVRLLLYRPPQNWNDGPGDNCPLERCFSKVEEAIPFLDALVEMASELGMYAIIDYHPVGGYERSDAIAWWSRLAPRYKDRTHVIYELCNEPVRWSAATYGPEDIQFEEEVYNIIRTGAPETHIILWSFGEASGNGQSMLSKVQAANIGYQNASVAYHPYGSYNPTEVTNLQTAGFPVMSTEIGGGSREVYTLRTSREEEFGVSWIWLDGTGVEKPWAESDPLPITWSPDPQVRTPSVVKPTVQPNGGSFSSVQVSLESMTLGATIYYTLDGSEPTSQSTLYENPFTLSVSATVRARAVKQNYRDSDPVAAAFSITEEL